MLISGAYRADLRVTKAGSPSHKATKNYYKSSKTEALLDRRSGPTCVIRAR